MRNTHFRIPTLLATAAAALAGIAGHAQRPVISQHIPEIVKNGQATYVSAMERGETLHLGLELPNRNQSQLDALLVDLYNPQSPNYRHWLTSQEFMIRFGPTREEFNTLVNWAQSKGLTITYQATDGRLIEVDATVEQINRVFNVSESKFHDSKLNRDFHAPDREPTTDLPFNLLVVSGLEDSQPKINHLMRDPGFGIPTSIAAPSNNNKSIGLSTITNGIAASSGGAVVGKGATSVKSPKLLGSGPSGSYLPSDMRKAYYGTGNLTGAGQSVGIFSFDGYLTSDLTVYYNNTGMTSSVPVNNVLVGNYSGACAATCDDGEQILDIVQVQGMAPGLTQILFYEDGTGAPANTILAKMASDNIAKVISCSWGGGGFGTASDTYFQQMATQGQSFLSATGDNGGFYKGNYAAPSFDPYITQVGGTDLATTSAGGAWSSEFGWSDSGGGFWITGMSASAKYATPAYQTQTGVITAANGASSTYRNVPDIAAEADFDNPTVSNGSFLIGYGGTSFAAPRLAGYMALANQQAVLNGQATTGLGLINTNLYAAGLAQQGGGTAYYHDSTSGTNPGTNETTGAASGPTYTSVAGYDLVTGWGSPNGTNLLNYLAGNPVANFSVPSSVSASMVRGGSLAVNLTVTGYNGYSGHIVPTNYSGLPAGWGIQYSAGTGYIGSPLVVYLSCPSTTGVGTYPVTLTVTDSANAALTQNVNVSVVVYKRANGDFAMTTSGVTIPKGSTGTAYIMVTPGSGLADVVNLSVTSVIPGVTTSFFDPVVQENTPKNVPLTINVSGATTPGTYSLTIMGSDAAGIVHTVQMPVIITTPTNLLVNGGFDTGSITPWTTTTSCAYSPILLTNTSGFEAQTGTYFGLMLSTGAACTQTLSQTVTIPAGSSHATLGLWDWILTGETGTTATDTLTISVVDSKGTSHTLGTQSNVNAQGYWTYYGFDMTPYLGQTVTVITAVEAGATITDILLDNISLVTM